ncbi:hypothetical protein D922_01659 [Enterococcus faecalis 06-MB-DW-09]|nr:hypothetical protein D922_01659 [Enterococcus faecalis 06-MB-DW-09]
MLHYRSMQKQKSSPIFRIKEKGNCFIMFTFINNHSFSKRSSYFRSISLVFL